MDIMNALRFLNSANFTDLRGHCRCLQWDDFKVCRTGKCWLYHEGIDCSSFTATGICKNPHCKLVHDEEKMNYAKQHPLRSDIPKRVAEFWKSIPTKQEVDVQNIVNTDKKKWLWENIVKGDAQMKIDFVILTDFVKACADEHENNVEKSAAARLALQNLERLFRFYDMNTWIIARKTLFFDIEEVSTAKTGKPDALSVHFIDAADCSCDNYLFVSCRQPEQAIPEIMQESATYNENFAKLTNCGFIVVKEKENNDKKE